MLKKTILLFTISLFLQSCTIKPKTVAHRGAHLDNTENTVIAFQRSIKSGADMLEMDAQVTKDDAVVLYHPEVLEKLTNCSGKISDISYNAIKKCKIQKNGKNFTIPTLQEALIASKDKTIMLDLKSNNTEKLINAIARTLTKTNSWNKIIFYSTSTEHIKYIKQNYPFAAIFQDRDSTREILVNLKLKDICTGELKEDYIAFEMIKNKLYIVEKLTLGNYETEVTNVPLLNKRAVSCIRKLNKNAKIFAFGIASQKDYDNAVNIGFDYVVLDSLEKIKLQ